MAWGRLHSKLLSNPAYILFFSTWNLNLWPLFSSPSLEGVCAVADLAPGCLSSTWTERFAAQPSSAPPHYTCQLRSALGRWGSFPFPVLGEGEWAPDSTADGTVSLRNRPKWCCFQSYSICTELPVMFFLSLILDPLISFWFLFFGDISCLHWVEIHLRHTMNMAVWRSQICTYIM